jgi:hypothetical protein
MDTVGTKVTLVLLGLNCLTAVGLFALAWFRKGGPRRTLLLYAWFTLVCPVAGPLLFGFSHLISAAFRARHVDMAAISFSRVREENVQPPDAETELNYVPLEDAVAFADITDLRRLLINILKTGDREMLASVSRAINNPDTEVSHYSAAAVLDTLSDFRVSLHEYIERLRTNPEDAAANVFILEYAHQILRMNVMNREEQEATIRLEDQIAETLFSHNLWYMKDEYYLWIIDLLISIRDFNRAEIWVGRAMQYQRQQLNAYKARLHLYYARQDSPAFFSCIRELQSANVPADQEMLDLIRAYGPRVEAKAGEAL